MSALAIEGANAADTPLVDDQTSWEPPKTFLRLTVLALLAGCVAAALALLVFAPTQPLRLLGPGLVALVAAVAGALLAANRIRGTKYVLAFGLWGVFVLIAVFNGGVHSSVVVAFPVLILMCGWQIGERAGLLAGGMTVLATLAFVVLEIEGLLPAAPKQFSMVHGAVQVVLAILSAALVAALVRANKTRLRQLQSAGQQLMLRGDELERSRSELHQAQAVARIGSWVYELDQDRMQLSDETCRIFGFPLGVTGNRQSYLKRVFEPDRALVEQAWEASMDGASFDHEHRILVGEEVRWIRQKAEFGDAGQGARRRRIVGITQDITERKRADERIAELAFIDQLSGLPNRTLLRDRLQQVMAASVRDKTYSALLFLDLDNFKSLNDTLGHGFGDLLLQQVARRLVGCVRGCDTVARLGGDEFVVMLPHLDAGLALAAGYAELVGEKILATLSQAYELGERACRSTPSIGITLFGGGLHESIDEPLKRADLAMYQAKAAGRNTLRLFDPLMQAAVADRAATEAGLRQALARGEFLLHFQPVMTGDGRVAGAEALVRWQHPVRQLIAPAEFIQVAEETALILPIGHWVLEQACVQLVAWSAQAGLSHLTLAVNVSARQFRQNDFVAQVVAAITRVGVNPRLLKLELTESILVSNVEDVITKMTALKALGVGFALDDFGTGYSSLSYLSRLPLDQLKIDRSFVMALDTSAHAKAISAATIGLAHILGLSVVAEGVENESQRAFLHTVQHCDYLQGYLFSRPLPIAQFEAFARAH